MKLLFTLSVPVAAAAATFLLLASNKVVLGSGDATKCTSDIDTMVVSSPELAQAETAYEDAVIDMFTSLLEATTGVAGIDPTILDDYKSACADAGGQYYLLKDTVFGCVVTSSGDTITITPNLGYCDAPTEACDGIFFSLSNLGVDNVPGYECALDELQDDDAAMEMIDDSGSLAATATKFAAIIGAAVVAALL